MRTSEQVDKISAAIVAAQGEMPAVPKTAINPHFRNKYAPLDAIVKATAPILAKHGLGVVQGGEDAPFVDGHVSVTTRIIHASGQWIESSLRMKPAKDDPQGVGACVTYGSRYGYRMLGVITDEDDDGNAASGAADNVAGDKQKAPRKPKTKTKTEAPASTQEKPDYKEFLEHMATARKYVGDITYYAACKAYGREHANEFRGADEMAAIIDDLRKLARAKKGGAV